MSTRSAILMMLLVATAAGLGVYAATGRAAPAPQPAAEDTDLNWLAEGPQPEGDLEQPAPPPPPGQGPLPGLRERLERLRRVQEQLRDIARENMPDQDTLRRIVRQLDEALAIEPPPGPRDRADRQRGMPDRERGLADRERGMAERERGQVDRGRRPEPRRPFERPVRPGRPAIPAEARLRTVEAVNELTEEMQQLLYHPLRMTMVAAFEIIELSKDDPKQGIAALEPLLEQEESALGRAVIHFALKDLHQRAGDRQAAIRQLTEVIKDYRPYLAPRGKRSGPTTPPEPAQRD